MKEDPIYKERFGISTPIRYMHDMEVDPRFEKSYKRAWRKFQNEMERVGPARRLKRFDNLIKKIIDDGDDLAFTKRIEIRFINKTVGFGVFAKERIGPYALLNSYAGLLRPDSAISSDNDSTFEFGDFKAFSVDAEKQGNWCRFMNHSPIGDPNTNVVAWEHYSEWGPRIIFTAGRKGIDKGAQLLYSYGDDYWVDKSFLDL